MPDGSDERRPPPRVRRADAERTRLEIIAAATAEFAEKGLSGTSVSDIAARTRTSKPMIYYYFDSKEALYTAVMEEAYGRIRDVEQGLRLDDMAPEAAMRHLVEVTFDYHADNPDFVRLISVENIHDARHIAGSTSLAPRNAAVIQSVRSLLERGEAAGVFRRGADAIDVHLMISSLCFHRISNRHSWRVLFGRDLAAPECRARQRDNAVEAVLGFLRP